MCLPRIHCKYTREHTNLEKTSTFWSKKVQTKASICGSESIQKRKESPIRSERRDSLSVLEKKINRAKEREYRRFLGNEPKAQPKNGKQVVYRQSEHTQTNTRKETTVEYSQKLLLNKLQCTFN